MSRIIPLLVCQLLFQVCQTSAVIAQTREEKVREDRRKVTEQGVWLYNDLPAAFQQAKTNGKPILVVLRCIPCEECVKLDDDLVDQDPVIRPLLEQFVCVRQISTNGLDLELFQYDTDQSFAVFMLNADGTIYGRFGTRSHRTEWLTDVSLAGMAQALQGALELHAGYPGNKASLAGKRGPKPEFASPEKFPSLASKYTAALNYDGDVVKSCIHCHQIGDAQRDLIWQRGQPIPTQELFPYPHPKSLGLILDPDQKATVKAVQPDSVAAATGFQVGDKIVSIAGQPPLSFADVQWVLHQTDPAGAALPIAVDRQGELTSLTMKLADGWRTADDISWRVSAWGYRRIALGGLVLKTLDDDGREQRDIADNKMALLVSYVGQYDAHAAGKRAGFQKDDVIIGFDGRDDLATETAVFQHVLTHRKIGDRVSVTVLRDGKRITFTLPIQE